MIIIIIIITVYNVNTINNIEERRLFKNVCVFIYFLFCSLYFFFVHVEMSLGHSHMQFLNT